MPTKTYNPHPATIPYRAIQHLKSLPPDAWIASAPLAEALGTDSSTLINTLATAVKYGMVRRAKRAGLIMWSLGDGVAPEPEPADARRVVWHPTPAPADATVPPAVIDDAVTEVIERHKAATAKPDGVDIDRVHAKPAKAKPAPKSSTSVPAPPDGFTFSWRSDGMVGLRKEGVLVALNATEAAQLRDFLNHMAVFEAA